jgi:hypothetical protein
VRNWLRLYTAEGLEALCTLQYQGSKGHLSTGQSEQLRAEVQTCGSLVLRGGIEILGSR